MKIRLILIACLLAAACGEVQPQVVEHDGVRYHSLAAERLPDLRKPLTGHVVLPLGDGFMVAGGHTTGFVPVQEAFIWRGGVWTTVPMLYPHDTPFALVMKDGRIVIGGSYAESFGIGQTWGVESYDPSTGKFSPEPIMDFKRAHASAVELSGGKLIIAGNWYGRDAIERYVFDDYDRDSKPLEDTLSYPYVLRSDVDNALIFGSRDGRYAALTDCIVRRWDGDSLVVPLFKQWHPYSYINHGPVADEAFTGDMSTGRFSYLIHAKDSLERQSALLKVSGETFSLLDTEYPIPSEGPWGPIEYNGYVQVDRSRETAWLLGVDGERRVYLAGIEYGAAAGGGAAPVKMYFTEPLEDVGQFPYSRVLADGRVVLAGGVSESNYEPHGAVYLFAPNPVAQQRDYLQMIVAGIVLLLVALMLIISRKGRKAEPAVPVVPPSMAERIESLMRDRQFFKRPNLRLADVAQELSTNTTYVSACINGETGLSFPDYVAGFRVRYAQDLLRRYPEKTIKDVAVESGFTNEKTFLRTFKAQTGMTPTEWREG